MYTFFRSMAYTCLCATTTVGSPTPNSNFDQPITLETAISMALQSDPALEWQGLRAEAAEALIEQADRRPLPTLEAEIENLTGTGEFSDGDHLELTLSVRQTIETDQKQEKRTSLARAEHRKTLDDRLVQARHTAIEVSEAFHDVLIAQEQVEMAAEFVQLAERTVKAVEELVAAARLADTDRLRAALTLRQRQLDLEKSQRDWRATREQLAVLWGIEAPPLFQVQGEISPRNSLPPIEEYRARIPDTAELIRIENKREVKSAKLKSETAQNSVDYEVFAGGRFAREANDGLTFVAGIEFPWPFAKANSGNIRAARAELSAIEYERAGLIRGLNKQITTAYNCAQAAEAEAEFIAAELLPAAEAVYEETQSGYKRSQYGLLRLLESEETLLQLRQDQLDALAKSIRARARLNALTRTATR